MGILGGHQALAACACTEARYDSSSTLVGSVPGNCSRSKHRDVNWKAGGFGNELLQRLPVTIRSPRNPSCMIVLQFGTCTGCACLMPPEKSSEPHFKRCRLERGRERRKERDEARNTTTTTTDVKWRRSLTLGAELPNQSTIINEGLRGERSVT